MDPTRSMDIRRGRNCSHAVCPGASIGEGWAGGKSHQNVTTGTRHLRLAVADGWWPCLLSTFQISIPIPVPHQSTCIPTILRCLSRAHCLKTCPRLETTQTMRNSVLQPGSSGFCVRIDKKCFGKYHRVHVAEKVSVGGSQ